MEDGRRLVGYRLALVLLASAVSPFPGVVGCDVHGGRPSHQRAAEMEPDSPMVPEVSAAVKAEILGLGDELTAVYKRRDWPALASLVAPDYLGSAPGFEWDLAKLEAEFPRVQLFDCRVEAATVKALAPGLVLLNQDAVLKETYSGQDISGRYRFTTVWARRDGRWRLVFEQEVPLSNPTEGKP